MLIKLTGGKVYEDLLEDATQMELGQGVRVEVVDLAVLIEMKEALGREKDRGKLPEYRRALEERRKREG